MKYLPIFLRYLKMIYIIIINKKKKLGIINTIGEGMNKIHNYYHYYYILI